MDKLKKRANRFGVVSPVMEKVHAAVYGFSCS